MTPRPPAPPHLPAAFAARPSLSEVFPETGAEAAAAAFVLAQAARSAAPVLWIQERLARAETGRPYLPGLGACGPLMLLQVARPLDAMAAAEEGLRCGALAAVVAEIRGNPPALGFTALKRLALRAEATGVPCWLIRQGAAADLSAARDRWRIATLPSAAHPDDPRAPGAPLWRAALFRSRDGRPGEWMLRHDRGGDGAADRFGLVAELPDGALAAPGRAAGRRAGR